MKKPKTCVVLEPTLKQAIRMLSKLEGLECIGCAGAHTNACPARPVWGTINSLTVSLNSGAPP